MPVFFFIDPAFAEDPNMSDVTEITLSYTFFQAKSGVPYRPGLSEVTVPNANTSTTKPAVA